MSENPIPKNLHFEIDGKPERFDYFYGEPPFNSTGSLWGMNETTVSEDKGRNFLPNKSVWILGAYRNNDDGSIFGIKGVYACGEWAETESGDPLLRVWDRIA